MSHVGCWGFLIFKNLVFQSLRARLHIAQRAAFLNSPPCNCCNFKPAFKQYPSLQTFLKILHLPSAILIVPCPLWGHTPSPKYLKISHFCMPLSAILRIPNCVQSIRVRLTFLKIMHFWILLQFWRFHAPKQTSGLPSRSAGRLWIWILSSYLNRCFVAGSALFSSRRPARCPELFRSAFLLLFLYSRWRSGR